MFINPILVLDDVPFLPNVSKNSVVLTGAIKRYTTCTDIWFTAHIWFSEIHLRFDAFTCFAWCWCQTINFSFRQSNFREGSHITYDIIGFTYLMWIQQGSILPCTVACIYLIFHSLYLKTKLKILLYSLNDVKYIQKSLTTT